jgi:hypothetical protein
MYPSKIDTNIDNYTLPELLTILELDTPTEENVLESTNNYIKKFQKEGNETMANFFQDVQDTLLNYVEGLDTAEDAVYEPSKSQATLWWNNQQVLHQPSLSYSKIFMDNHRQCINHLFVYQYGQFN